jgi:ABC-type polysaccharide/polyol phosphate export permease
MNISILIKAQGLNDMYNFFLMNLIILTYLIIYQIENPIKLNKKLTILVKIILVKWDI